MADVIGIDIRNIHRNIKKLGVMDKINGFSEDLFANGQK